MRRTTLRLAIAALLLAPGFRQARAQVPTPGWQVAGPYPLEQVDRGPYPNFYSIFLAGWRAVPADETGRLDLSPHFPRENPGGDLVIARRIFRSDDGSPLELTLEYEGEIDVFFNRRKVFSGRAPECAGYPGQTGRGAACRTRIPLPARRELNEIFLMAGSRREKWEFRAETSEVLPPKPMDHGSVEEIWTTPDTFLTSESVLKDPRRDLFYVTSFDNRYATRTEPSGYISTLSGDGRILEHTWLGGLNAPTGMDIRNDTLWVCERAHLLAIDLETRLVVGRWPIPDVVFPNDLVVGDDGSIFVSDTRTGNWPDSRIYRFKEGVFEVWANEGIDGANGLWIHKGGLIVGNSGDGTLKRVDLTTRRMETLVSLGSGIIDGIRVDEGGNFLVSFWEGQLFRISPEGEVVELLDAMPARWNTADFEYLPEEGILLIPTFLDNRVRAVRVRR